ncbi:hypothetical protein [Eubacterium sp.]|uniref:hypothetical protein n=1 Tax=Eubacterium sp. TaxID=142586 RepID=UPI0015AA2E30
MVSITVDQSINTDDVNVANGTPAFIVKVTNNATERTYQDIIVYEKEEKSREAKEQHFTKMPEGEYTVAQVPGSRYLSVVENSESTTTTVEAHEDITVSYMATRYERRNYSDCGTAE